MKLTPWFPPDVKPVRPGVYLTQLSYPHYELVASTGYSWWTGAHWMGTQLTVERAARVSEKGVQNKRWRGLATGPGSPLASIKEIHAAVTAARKTPSQSL